MRYVLEGSVQPSGNQVRVNAQLIDADSGAHLWADQFDTPRADLLQMQDEIVTRLARAMDIQLLEAEAARLKRTQAANPDAEDLALQCEAGVTERRISRQGSGRGLPSLRAGARCRSQQCPRPEHVVRQVLVFGHFGRSADPKADLKRADELVSKALALDPNYASAHSVKAGYSPFRDASTKRSRRTNARSPWTPPC